MRRTWLGIWRWLNDSFPLLFVVGLLCIGTWYVYTLFRGTVIPKDAKTIGELAKNLAEAAAWLAGGLFFGYKAWSGYFLVNMSIKVECQRRRRGTSGIDDLQVTVILSKGNRGTLQLHDIQARITPDAGRAHIVPFEGFDRLKHLPESFETMTRRVVQWELRNEGRPLLSLTPGEVTQFSHFCSIPSGIPVKVEVAVIGKRKGGLKTGQWRASLVSLPEETPAKSTWVQRMLGR